MNITNWHYLGNGLYLTWATTSAKKGACAAGLNIGIPDVAAGAYKTHMVSGITVCVVLFVLFFAGSFAFFRRELAAWQNNAPAVAGYAAAPPADYNRLLDSLWQQH